MTAKATNNRPVTSSAWSPSTRPDERNAREVRVGGGCLREVDFRVLPEREDPDRLPERPVDRPLPEERDPPDRERDDEREPWRVVTVATTASTATSWITAT